MKGLFIPEITAEMFRNGCLESIEILMAEGEIYDIDYPLEQEPCEMTAEEYRQRMIQVFHNADCDRLIAVCVLPTEKEFEHLEWLLKNHYKKKPCVDCVNRESVNTLVDELARAISDERCHCPKRGRETGKIMSDMLHLPSVQPKPKTGHWITPVQDDGMSDPMHYQVRCSECGFDLDPQTWHMELHQYGADKFCPNCGAKMESEDEEGDRQ